MTGGPESIHKFISELDKIEGVRARIWYWGDDEDPCPDDYKVYKCDYVTELPDNYSGVLIMPEIWANGVMDYPYAIRCINWMGVDAYASWTKHPGAFLKDDSIIHLVQSEYARDFLQKLGVKHILKDVDVLNADFFKPRDERERYDTVLYNPVKATDFTCQLMAEARKHGIEFRPIEKMSRTEVIELMTRSKLYIDFGDFPGRERLPREAVLCGCCIITGAVGSARFYKDITIPDEYKFDRKESHIFAIIKKMQDVLNDYGRRSADFYTFRYLIREDRYTLTKQCREFVDEVQHYYTGT